MTLATTNASLHQSHRAGQSKDHPGLPPIRNDAAKISFIYNYYAKESTVFRALDSLLTQTPTLCSSDEIEIILVDDGTEGEDVRHRLSPKVTYIWQRKNRYGICRAKNTGAKLANGKYLVFIDPDIVVCKGFVDEVLRGFQEHGDRIVQCGFFWDYYFAGSPDPRAEFGVWENPGVLTSRWYQVATTNLAISRSLFFETPGFDEDLIHGGVEDLLFGYQVGQLPATALLFNRAMESWHLPHPPSIAHAEPHKSWEIVRRKYPRFYEDYIVKELR